LNPDLTFVNEFIFVANFFKDLFDYLRFALEHSFSYNFFTEIKEYLW